MKRSELVARTLIAMGILAAVAAPLWIWSQTPLLHARMAENGGWTPDFLQAKVGEPIHLHLTSDDVMHGFAVGGMAMKSVDVEPGKVTSVSLTFDRPGTYTFYCTRWCGINHWRMRGTIEVSGGTVSTSALPAVRPLYVTLGLDIDAPHPASVVPDEKPSATRGSMAGTLLAQDPFAKSRSTADYYRSHAPAEMFAEFRADPALKSLTNAQVWDLVAYFWQSNTTAEGVAQGKTLFAQNCAACHGESGAGNGVFADRLAAAGKASAQTMAGAPNMAMQRPANFADPEAMLGASPALLQGKILRGGMGTGMPTWGVIFNQDQIWDIISYLYTFQFQESTK